MTFRPAGAAFFISLFSSAAFAQSCADNFTVEGAPMVTAVNYKSWRSFARVDQKAALDRVHRAMLAEGFNPRVDRGAGAITAVQETSGSGRPQTLRVVVRRAGGATRIDAVFMVQPGQVAPEGLTRSAICRVIDAAAG